MKHYYWPNRTSGVGTHLSHGLAADGPQLSSSNVSSVLNSCDSEFESTLSEMQLVG